MGKVVRLPRDLPGTHLENETLIRIWELWIAGYDTLKISRSVGVKLPESAVYNALARMKGQL